MIIPLNTWFQGITAVWFLSAPLATAEDKGVSLFDFEAERHQDQWTAAGTAAAAQVASTALEGPPTDGVKEKCMTIKTTDGGMVYSRPGLVPADWRTHPALRLHLHRPASQKDKRLILDVMALDDDGTGQLWRRLDLAPFTGWARIDMPLRFFGPGDGRILRWDGVRRFGLRVVGAAEFSVDSISLLPPGSGPAALLDANELSGIAFGKPAADTLKHEKGFLLLTDVPGVDFKPLVREMEEVVARVASWLPLGDADPGDPPVLVIFSTEDAYRGFAPRYAAAIKRELAPPQSAGFTINGIATAFWDPSQGLRRPTFLHEFVHSLVEKRMQLPNRSEWFQEAVANHLQQQLRPMKEYPPMITKAVLDPAFQVPLPQLCNGQPISTNQYWQCFTLFDLFLSDPTMRDRLPQLIDAFRKAGNTDLGPHLEPIFATDWKTLDTRWRAFTLGRFAPQQ
jgi:hypothetical protein